MSNKATNMISIRSDVYPETSLAEKKSVSGVPTVLYVNSEGKIQEVEKSRDKAVMANLVSNRPETSATEMANTNMSVNSASATEGMTNNAMAPVVPGTRTMPSELSALPGSKGVSDLVVSDALEEMVPEQPVGSQRGGNFGPLVRAAGPAALLLGAYAAFGRTRSSGLPSARTRSRRVRFSRRKRSTKRLRR